MLYVNGLVSSLNTHQAPAIDENSTADSVVENLGRYLAFACDACMPPSSATSKLRKPVQWWSDEISDLRKECIKANSA